MPLPEVSSPSSDISYGYQKFLENFQGSKLLVSLEPGRWSKIIMGIGLGGLVLTGLVPDFTRKIAPLLYFCVALLSYLFTIFAIISYLYYRSVRPFQQRRLNENLGNRIEQTAAPILYLRPFGRSGRFLVRNPLESQVDRMLMGPLWDFELALSLAVRSHYEMVAIGHISKGLGSAKFIVEDKVWKETFVNAAALARVIVMIPHDTPGTIWEMEQIVSRPEWLRKTVFFMPPTFHKFWRGPHAKDWERTSKSLQEKGITLPSYDNAGQIFMMDTKNTWTSFPHHHLQKRYAFTLISYLDYLLQKPDQSLLNPVEMQKQLSAIKVEEVNYSLDSFWQYLLGVVGATLIAVTLKVFVVQAFKIPSGSMIPTLLIGDHILVSKLSYGIQWPSECQSVFYLPLNCYASRRLISFGSIQRGDIIVFRFPEDEDKDFIKRVIGLPGDTIQVRNKVVLINGTPFDDHAFTQHTDPLVHDGRISPRDNFGPVTVPEDAYFVMGDNRDHSLDSRFWGYVRTEKIRGKAFRIYWSWSGQGTWNEWVRWERVGLSVK